MFHRKISNEFNFHGKFAMNFVKKNIHHRIIIIFPSAIFSLIVLSANKFLYGRRYAFSLCLSQNPKPRSPDLRRSGEPAARSMLRDPPRGRDATPYGRDVAHPCGRDRLPRAAVPSPPCDSAAAPTRQCRCPRATVSLPPHGSIAAPAR